MQYHQKLALILSLTLLGFFACKSFSKKDATPTTTLKNNPKSEMPIPALPLLGDYAEEWKIVDSLQEQGLFKSALEKVEAIQARASRDKNGQQIVKALLFRGKFITMLEEDGLTNAIQLLEKETLTAGQPEKSVLQSILGQLYATYLQHQSWTLRDRTPIPEGEGGDILTWSADQIEKHALELYTASVSQDALLRGIPVEQFRDITTESQLDSIGQFPLRPFLFDLLAHRALDHFSNERSYLTEPAYVFQLSSPEDFADWDIFQDRKYETQDLTSGKWHAIQLFQKMLRAHNPKSAGDQTGAKAALFEVDLKRLQFVWNNSTLENKNELYRIALNKLKKQAENHPSDGEVVHALASFLYNLETGDKGENARTAVTELEAAIRRHPDTYGAALCRELLRNIRTSSLSAKVEEVNVPNQPLLVHLDFRNLKKVWVKVVRTDFEQETWEVLTWDEQFDYLQRLSPLQSRSWDIQDPGDYQAHRTEIALESLPLGNYYVFVANNAEFKADNGSVNVANFAVSNIASVTYNELGQARIVLADRSSGAPLAGVKLDLFNNDYNSGRLQYKLVGTVTSDRDGFIRDKMPLNGSMRVRASLGKDTLWIGQVYNNRYNEKTRQTTEVHFFTDRSIYRPGQTVYFKGLVYRETPVDGESKRMTPQIVPNQTVTVKFHDANGQIKNTLKLKSNAFGTFHGTFTAPSTGLTGGMSIHASDGARGQTYFSVEEYKRPRFEVTLKPMEGEYRVNDLITARGEAKNYAGNVVDGAQVKYRVVRVARFPFWDFYSNWRKPRPWYFDSPEMEIANGTTSTGADGSFAIEFKAIPDPNIPKKDQPVFDYQVFVDVTDITGETQSNTSSISAGYVALQVTWDLPGEMPLDSFHRVGIHTTNMAGQNQPAQGEISLQRLVAPKQFFKNRLWENPDITTIGQQDFERMFPEFAWKNADDPEKWGREDFTRTVKFNTATDKVLDLHQGRSQEGWYLAKLSTRDAFGEPIEIQRFVRLYNADTRFVKPGAAAEKTRLEPGETARFTFGGQPQGLYFFFAQALHGALQQPEWVSSHLRGLSKVEIPVRESDRGGFSVHYFCIKNSRLYGVGQIYLDVPWSNKDLNISYETFRDKLAPGQKETWRIKISGPKKDKVAAEMVAAMYDASLDQFRPHQWSGIPYPTYYSNIYFNASLNFGLNEGQTRWGNQESQGVPTRSYRELNWFDFPMWRGRYPRRDMGMDAMMLKSAPEGAGAPGAVLEESVAVSAQRDERQSDSLNGNAAPPAPGATPSPAKAPPAPIRRNLNETVFFFPEMRTDADGNLVLNFTMNEALTRWKLLTYTHTKELQQVLSEKEVVTQKELMVIANPPRFLRQGDEIEFSAKVSNLSKEKLEGTASLGLLDATTLSVVESAFGLAKNNRLARFSVLPGQSGAVSWRVKVPADYSGAVTWQIFAEANSFRDGEESTIPVVSNRMLVTETLPISLRGQQTKTFTFENLKKASASNSLTTQQLTLEFTSNPVWYAVQSLPYLMEFPHECSEQIFSRLYANTLASSVTEKMPQVKRVYERWKGTDALKSNLSKNQELKYALLEETPWVLDAQNETQQKQNIALLFDLNRMADERERALNALAERQLNSGGWPWFSGGQDSWYITQYIVSGFMHLEKLGAFDPQKDQKTAQMLDKALGYCDRKLNEQYATLERLAKDGKTKMEDDHLDGMAIQYLYARSFRPVDRPGKEIGYYLGQAEKYWLGKGLYQEGLLALALHRYGRKEAAAKIVASLKERATMKEELGMYWPVDWGFYWYQLPVETQALMVEVFSEVAMDPKAVEELRIWLLKNKQTNRWESTKATAEAVYALLLNGDNWLNNTKPVQVSLGGTPLKVTEYEAGTGYFKQSWAGSEVKKSWADIKVENPNTNIVWGAAYWQYFEDLDQIKDFQKTPLTIVKQLFLEVPSATGPILQPITEGQSLKRGDKLKVRMEIRVDRPMEFVHLKDMRASGFEPINVLSGYRWQGGLGYYESTKDLATHFFIDYLPRGTFVFEYPLVVSLRGDMSNGITTMQCMYAPEFTSHSKGIRVKVE